MIVGHPDETEDDFAEMKQFVKDMRFERLGAFVYSHEEGTYAYANYTDNIPNEEKQRRLDEIMAIQQEIASEISDSEVGKTLPVIVDRKEGGYFVGRTEHDSPEVDPEVLITVGTPGVEIGSFYNAHIIDANDFELIAE